MIQPFTMSIEETEGKSVVNGYHLGTYEDLARCLIEERFRGRIAQGMPTITIALMHQGKIVDVYYGDKWNSEYEVRDEA